MSVKIRLMRVGKRKQPTYRVVVADGRSPRDGRIIESIVKYGPRQEPSLVDIDGEKALAWLRKGAQPTEQVQKLLAAAGVWEQYEQEKGGPVRTKLFRRGVTPGTTPPPPKQRKSKKAEAAAAAPAAEPAAEPAPEAGDEAEPASATEEAGESSRPEEEEQEGSES